MISVGSAMTGHVILTRFLWALGCLFLVWVGAVHSKPKAMATYTVQKGDTFLRILQKHGIEQRYLSSVTHANPHIADADKLRPGDKLVIPTGQGALRKLSPKVRRTILKDHGAFDLATFKPFLNRSGVFSPKEIESAPTVIQLGDRSTHHGRNTLYAQIMDESTTSYAIIRPLQTYHDPSSREILGVEGHYIGEAQLTEIGHPAQFHVEKHSHVVRLGDKLVPSKQQQLPNRLTPKLPRAGIEGQIIATLGENIAAGSYQAVVINKGQVDNLRAGDTLNINKQGPSIKGTFNKKHAHSVQLPHRTVGKLIVFKTFARVSYGLILQASTPIKPLDFVSSASSH